MYFNGASNALGRGVGAVLISPKGNHCPFIAKLSFDCTNNVAYASVTKAVVARFIKKKIIC